MIPACHFCGEANIHICKLPMRSAPDTSWAQTERIGYDERKYELREAFCLGMIGGVILLVLVSLVLS